MGKHADKASLPKSITFFTKMSEVGKWSEKYGGLLLSYTNLGGASWVCGCSHLVMGCVSICNEDIVVIELELFSSWRGNPTQLQLWKRERKGLNSLQVSRIRLFSKGKKHGRMILDLIDNGPLVYPTVEENWQTRPKKYFELTKSQQLQDDCDVQATNIILHGLPPNVYALVNHQEAAKDIWDIVKLLMKGTELSYKKRDCRLYNLFTSLLMFRVKHCMSTTRDSLS
nr:hypothetical protein [Tanacetum cinerariifolium]